MGGSEDRLIAWLRRRLGSDGDLLGDDAAFVGGRPELAISVDQQIEGVHFPSGVAPAAVGRRLVGVAISDLAAVGAVPSFALLAVAAPPATDLRELLDAAARACRRLGCDLAGGDLARADRLAAGLTVAGRRPPRGRWVRRDAARPDDRLWLGGPVGASALGRRLVAAGARLDGREVELPADPAVPPLVAAAARGAIRRHLAPEPQLELGQWLAGRRRAAAIDLSDGLGLDLDRLCRASGCGAVVEAARLPLPDRRLAAHLSVDPESAALGGGEDYVLLFALPPRIRPPARLGAIEIGRMVRPPGLEIVRAGRRQPLSPTGWDHLA